MNTRITLMAIITFAASLMSGAAYAWSYTVTDLYTPGSSYSSAYAVNASGQVTGNTAVTSGAWIGLRPHAFLYSNGAMTDLGTLGGGGAMSFGHGINDAGQVVGYSETKANGDSHAFLYSNGTMTDLGTLGGSSSVGFGINNAGQVTGYANTSNSTSSRAFLYSDGTMTDLGTLGGTNSIGYGINDAGQVTGLAYTSSSSPSLYHAFLYSNGSMTDLGTLNGHNYSEGRGINASGQVTGISSVSSGNGNAFLYSNGVMIDLGTMGGISSIGYGINSAGQVVGSALMGTDARDRGIYNAFLYGDGTMTNLNTLIDPATGWTLYEARGINDAGQIVGWGISPIGGEFHAFLLTPVPEPSTYALFLAGLGLVGFMARRRKHARVQQQQ